VKIAPSPRPMRRPVPLAQRKLRKGIPRTTTQRSKAAASPARPSVAPAAVAAAEEATPAPTPVLAPAATFPNALALRGGFWEITYEGRAAIVEHCRGLQYIAVLLQGTGADRGPIHAKELVARATGQAGPTELEAKGEVLDERARRQLLDRLEEIASERDRACAIEAFDRAEALDAEYERIAGELSRANAPRKGSARRSTFTDAGEKARKAVGKAISEAIARIASHPDLSALAEHLSSSIRKGQWLSYTGNANWRIELRPPLPRK
jgi:hypothetical protein